MKFQNRLASVLTGAMLAVNSIGAQAFDSFGETDALETIKKVGMTKIYTFETEERLQIFRELVDLRSEDNPTVMDLYSGCYTVPVNELEGDTLWVCIDVDKVPGSSHLELELFQTWLKRDEFANVYVEDGQLHRQKSELTLTSSDQLTLVDEDGSSVFSGESPFCFRLKTGSDPSCRLDQIEFILTGELPASEAVDFDIEISVYGKKKTDTPDPSLSEITGTTTGTAAVGDYDNEDAMYVTDENGRSYLIETNVFCCATLDIRQDPKRVFAVGEPFSTEGLKVVMTEHRLFNKREHDVSDCLQIRTDYDPNTPGEYTVYIRTDYNAPVAVHSDDYLFYTVRVDGDLTTAETTETTESLTAPDITALPGDVDRNGQVAIADAVLLARYLAEDAVTVTAQGLINAELDGDDSALSSSDLSMLLQIIAGTANL